MKILCLDHVALPVDCLESSCHFYSQVLGLERMSRPDFSFPGAWFRLGSTQELHLISRGTTVSEKGPSYDRHFALRVDCVSKAVEHLKNQTWPHRAPKQRPDGVWQLFLKDPDGHSIELFSDSNPPGPTSP